MCITKDYFYKKKVIVNQHKDGFRFSIDAPILADFLPVLPGEEALEVGTGSGVVSLLALYKQKFALIYGLDVQLPLTYLACRNARENGFSKTFLVLTGDFNKVYRNFSGSRHIFSNPPYFEVHRGRLSPHPEIRDAKSETRLTLAQLLEKSAAILGQKGNLYLVLPYARYRQLMQLAPGFGYSIAKLRRVFSFKDGKEERFLVQLTNYDVSPVELPPLIIFKTPGVYTDEMDKILTG